jgi:hypothetical protein
MSNTLNKIFSWRTINSPISLDAVDASIAFDELEDLEKLKIILPNKKYYSSFK